MALPSSAICRMRLRRTETAANSAATYSAVIATIEVTTSKGVSTSAARARTREPGAGSRRRHQPCAPTWGKPQHIDARCTGATVCHPPAGEGRPGAEPGRLGQRGSCGGQRERARWKRGSETLIESMLSARVAARYRRRHRRWRCADQSMRQAPGAVPALTPTWTSDGLRSASSAIRARAALATASGAAPTRRSGATAPVATARDITTPCPASAQTTMAPGDRRCSAARCVSGSGLTGIGKDGHPCASPPRPASALPLTLVL